MRKNFKVIRLFALLFLVSCAGFNRSCSACMAESYGSDWVVVQYNYNGSPLACWKLLDASVSNEEHSDGIYWVDSKTRHLVHISGWYNRVQVEGGDFEGAANLLGVELRKCQNGKYE